MNKKVIFSKKVWLTVAAFVFAICLSMGAFFAVPGSGGATGWSMATGSLGVGETRDNERVQMSDLFKRYPSDYVIGPIDAASSDVDPETGKYTYIENEAHKDINGNYTNNIYGIPADQYLDVESYIYTTGTKDSTAGRTLYGWKPNIRAVLGTGSQKGKLAENGKIMSGASVTEDIGIYATFETGQVFGSTEKYVLIVPSDITKIGTGSAAYVYGNKAYYQDYTSGTTVTTGQAYTDFSCFIYSDAIAHYQEPYFWQPRERLVGVYFPDDSRLTAIDGATYSGDTPSAAWTNNRTFKKLAGKGAFERCDSLRFLILPNELTSIGKHAFWSCTGIVDMNIPTKVTTIGNYAFGSCTSVRVLPRPETGGTISGTAYNGCSFEDEGTIYIMGGAPTVDANGNKVYDNGLSGFIFKKNGSSWEAKGLSGETGEDKNKVFILPDSADFSAVSDRRRGVEYDYIGRDGTKQKNTFPEGGVTSYKIADSFAAGKWCQNVIMPKAVTEIGASAFSGSHVKYLETYATTISKDAFTGSENNEGDDSGNQWYYFHKPDGNPTYSIPNDAFVAPGTNVTRHIVFESREMYNSVGTTFTGLAKLAPNGTSQTGASSRIHWQIPVYANIYSEDVPTYNGEGVTLVEGDLEERFYYDSDYIAKSDLKQGNNVILYTKRLSRYDFTATKQATGGWLATGEGAKHSNPTLGHMQSTVWYTGTDYSASTTASDRYTNTMTTPVNIYTKNIAANAKIETKTYDFGADYDGLGTLTDDPGNDSTAGSFAFNASLGLGDDYASAITAFVYPNGSALNPAATYVKNVRHAGTYTFAIGLDAKWGVWKDDYNAENREATVTVERQKFDLTSLDKIPEFKTTDGSSLRGDNTTLYRYNDGWYLTQRNGEEPISSVVVTNAYVYDTGNEMTLALTGFNGNDEKSAYGYLMSTNSYPARGSGEYYTTYTFGVKYIEGAPGQTDYEFYYGAADDDSRFGDLYDDALGLRLDRKTAASARVNKRWYIVTETNYFIDAAETAPDETTAPYVPVFLNGDPVYSWAYESVITVKTPRLMYNMDCVGNDTVGTEVVPTIEIAYTPVGGRAVVIKSVDDNGLLSYYINSAMPVGSYTVTVYGGGVRAYFGVDDYKTYQPVSGTYVLNVLPAKLNAAAVAGIDTAIKGTSTATIDGVTVTANAYPDTDRKLHDALALDDINDTLNTARSAAAEATNYWAATANNGYYEAAVTLAYNLEGSGNTTYVNYSTALSLLVSAKEYQLYYSISAKNYETYGGESDADRRDKTFYTVIFTDMKISSVYTQYIADITSPYFKNVVYSGEEEHTLVPSSQYYQPFFTDANYIDVRAKATVTLRLYNAQLAKWTYDYNDVFTAEEAAKYFTLNGNDLIVYFDIVAAQNDWSVTPQMPSWTFNGFDEDVNFITAGLTFAGMTIGGNTYAPEVKYALIPSADYLDAEYGAADATAAGAVFFTVIGGKVDAATAIKLNALKPGSYYLKSYISDLYSDGSTAAAEGGSAVVDVKGFTYIAKNTSDEYIATVTVSKAANSWASTPNVMTWTFGDYDRLRHTITAVPVYPDLKPQYKDNDADADFVYTNGGAALPVVQFVLYKKGEGSADERIRSFKAGEDISGTLQNLHAGTYVLATSVGGSDYYLPIAETKMDFSIGKAVNVWTTTPQVVQWTWGEYSAAKNIISAAAKYEGGDGTPGSVDQPILFSVLDADHNPVVVTIAGGKDVTLDEFEIDQGMITNEDMAAAFAALDAGDYYLRAFKEGNNDYSDIMASTTTDIPFTVGMANNSWTTSPGMTSWQYKTFTSDNFRAGEPKYENTASPATYTLTKKAGGEFTFGDNTATSFTLTFTEDGALTQDMINAFTALAVGDYVIIVVQAKTNDFGPLSYDVNFSVIKTSNSWEADPGMKSWSYKGFTSSLFTAGAPSLNEVEGAVVQYTVYVKGTSTVAASLEFVDGVLSDATVTALTNLAVGSYRLTATYVGTTNYDPLTRNIDFDVTRANNSWEIAPGMIGWTYGSYRDNLFTAGVPTIKESTVGEGESAVAADVVYTLYKTVDGVDSQVKTFTTLADAEFDKLDAGDYVIVAGYVGTTNYKDLSSERITFSVGKYTNTWNPSPVLRGWIYEGFSSSLFTAGVPARMESVDDNGNEADVVYVVKGGKLGADGLTLEVDENGALSTTSVTALTNLGVGSYTLTVSYIGTDNYNAISIDVRFDVSKYTNTWNQSPILRGWNYKGFTESLFTAGVPMLDESNDSVTYVVTGDKLDNPLTLTVTNGVLDATSVTALTNLVVGSYTLTATYAGTDNYDELTTNPPITFAVNKISNSWSTRPGMRSWTYGAFDASLFTAGVPTLRDDSDAEVEYTLYKVETTGDTFIKKFTLLSEVDFAALDAGNYRIDVVYAGTDNYYALDTDVITFQVTPVANSWDKQPAIMGYIYAQFDESRNFIAGDPHYPLDSNTVYYIIGKAAYETVTTLDAFRALEGDENTETYFTTTIKSGNISAFNGLGYGTYYFAAFVPGSTNYSYLFYSGSFSVSQTGNNWDITPDISGWTYGKFANGLVHNGRAQYGTVGYTVRKVVDGNVVEGDEGIATVAGESGTTVSLSGMTYAALTSVLNKLDAGSYSLIAATEATSDYTAATFSKQFTVAKANNEWGTNPSISGWTFGGVASTPNNGVAKYESADATVSGAYYGVMTVNGSEVANLNAPVVSVVDAGRYAYVLTVADTTNYNGFSSTLFFTVAQAANGWNTSPAGTYSWTWGEDISQKIANFVGASAVDGSITFSIVGTTTTATKATIADVLGNLAVGDYTITATVVNSDNYTSVPMATAYVTVSRATFGITEPSCSGWTWGVADANKVFDNIAVTTSKASDVATITYRVSNDNGSTWTDATTYYDTVLLPYLKNRPAGAYTVSIVVTCDNYTDVVRTVNFTVSEATISWAGTAQNVSWNWDNTWTDVSTERVVPELTATDCAGNAITLAYMVNGTDFDSFAEMKAYLRSNDRDAAVYNVSIVAQTANHTTSEKTFTVTVNVATNVWTTEPDDSYRFEYQSWSETGWQGVPTPAAKFGTDRLVIAYGNTNIPDINEWIKTLSASETAYVLTLTVEASENQYSRLYKEVRITVAGKGSSWFNHDDLLKVTGATDTTSSYSLTYTKTLFESLLDTVVLPLGNTAYGSTTYSLTLDGKAVKNGEYDYFSLAALQTYLKDDARTAGVYVIVARYEPTDKSFATLTYTVTINVSKGAVGWSVTLNDSYSMVYGSVVLDDPAATEDFAEIDIVVKDKNGETLDMEGKKLSDFVKTLDRGEYKITASIKASDNYIVTGQPFNCTLYITAIANAWKDTTVGDKTITAAEWNAGYTWTFTRGDTISVILPEFVTGTLEISFNGSYPFTATVESLNSFLNNNATAAGRYTLAFSVEATDNYNGLISNCVIVVNKKSNTWTTPLATYTGSGSVKVNEFTMPEAEFGDANVDLRLFNIVKVGETSSEWYTYNTFVTRLTALEDGTFTVTVRMGGSAHAAALDEFKLALNAYNADYEEITCSCTVNLSPSTNSWTTKFTDVSWTWGETPTIVRPAADYGNAKIVYTISGAAANDTAVSVTVDSNRFNESVAYDDAFDALKAAIKALAPGRYTVTATIAATGLYAAPTDSNFAILTVSKNTASWHGLTAEQLAAYNLTSATWNSVANDFMPALSVDTVDKHGEAATSAVVEWRIGNEVLDATDNIITALNGKSAGTYVVTATYAGDTYNESVMFSATITINPVTTAWTDETAAAIAAAANLNWTYGDVPATNLPEEFHISNWAGKEKDLVFAQTKSGVTSAIDDWSKFVGDLATLGYGNYRITVTLQGDGNHTALNATFIIDVDRVETAWSNQTAIDAAASLAWTYGEKPEATTIPTPVLANWTDGVIAYSFTTNGGSSTTIPDFAAFVADLNTLHTGRYVVTAAVTGDGNHTSISATFVIEVERVTTAWSNRTAIDAAASLAWTYGARPEATTIPTPVLANWADGNIVYSYTKNGGSSTAITDFAAFVAGLNALDYGRYIVTASVTGDTDHTALSATFVIEISTVVTAWTENVGDSTILGWTYGKKPTTTVLPTLAIANWDEGKIVYTVTIGENTTTITDWNSYIDDPKLAVGTYVFTATVTGDGNHTSLTFTATATVSKLDVAWSDNTTDAETAHSWVLGATGNSELVEPTLNADNMGDCTVTYTLVKVGASGSLYSGTDWDGENGLLSELGKQKAGSYRITAKVSGDGNYNLPADVTYTVTISAQPNAWTSETTKTNVEWTYRAANNATIVFEPVYNKSLLTITVAGETVAPAQLMSELRKLGYGTYSIVASVGANDEYAAPETISITLTVGRASNSLDGLAVTDWVWDDVTQKASGWESAWNYFTAPVPAVGNSVIVTVRVKTSGVLASTATIEMTLTYIESEVDGVTVKKVNENDLNALKARLLALGVLGANQVYTVQVEVPMSDNYASATTPAVEFNVTKATNEWDGSNGAPHIQGWDFRGEIANPSSNPKFGKQTVRYTYATIKAGDEDDEVTEPSDPTAYEWLASTKTEAGMYWLRAIVPGTDNYSELVGYAKFSVNAAQNGWINDPSVIAWAWDGYDRNANLFGGSARNGIAPTFKIFKGTTAYNTNLAPTDFKAPTDVTLPNLTGGAVAYFSTTGFKLESSGDVKVVSDNAAQWLNALKPGKYVLYVYVPGGDSYDSIDKYVGFEIRFAENSWKVEGNSVNSPKVGNYYYGEPSFEEGVATYGTSNVRYAIIGNGNDTDISGTDNAGITADDVTTELKSLPAGSYTLRAWILGDNLTFNPRYSYGEPYSVTFTVNRAANGWKTAPQNVAANYTALHASNASGEDNFAANFESEFGRPEAIDGAVRYRLLNTDNTEAVAGYLDYDGLVAALETRVGEYSIESSVIATVKYEAILPVITSVNIRRYTSMFGDSFPTRLDGKWSKGNTALTSSLADITAAYGVLGDNGKLTDSHDITALIKFELNGTAFDATGFVDAVKALDAVTYQVTVFVAATNDYGEISRTIQLVIARADNDVHSAEGFTLETSSIGSGAATVADALVTKWKWSSKVAWQGVTVTYGQTVYVSVRDRGTTTDLRRFTIDYSDASLVQSALNTIGEYISGLGVGKYTLLVETPADVNWNTATDSLDFEVERDDNGWKTDGTLNKDPYISGGDSKLESGKYVWTYGAAASVKAAAVHGEPDYKFFNGNTELDAMPTNAGTYSVEISVPLSDNFVGIDKITINFEIVKAYDDYFTVAIGATGWTWGQYDRTVNVFTGTPRVAQIAGATVEFSIGTGTGDDFAVVSVGTTKLEHIVLENGLVSKTVGDLIAQLEGGTSTTSNTTAYTLRVTVGETDNYLGFSSDIPTPFIVTGARNEWTTPPQVAAWAVGLWNEDEYMPKAIARYGDVTITIRSQATEVVYFEATYINRTGDLDITTNDLNYAPAGWYDMVSTVDAVTGNYNNALSDTISFQIFLKAVEEVKNYWVDQPAMASWEANVEGIVPMPTGVAARGKSSFVFFKTEIVNGIVVKGEQIGGDDEFVVVKADNKNNLAHDIRIPVAPGEYIMEANAQLGENDKANTATASFTIRPRSIAFEDEPRIETLLYLGDRANWAGPSVKTTIDDAEITFVYTDRETGEVVSINEMPNRTGKFILTTYASAKYTLEIYKPVAFSIELSPNSWVSAPNIKDWSEENDPNNPFGEASVGTEYIKYTYVNVKDPSKVLTERPTTEGSYIMYADVDIEGYEPLHAEYRFTIEPAFDVDLLTVDIVLGAVACAIAVVVIIFAVRRYKEN